MHKRWIWFSTVELEKKSSTLKATPPSKCSRLTQTYWTTFSTEPSIPAECTTYNTFNDSSRYWGTRGDSKCDNHLVSGHWYRFMGAAGVMMATYCIPIQSCDAYMSGWINGHHPNKTYEKVSGSACMHYVSDCCYYSYNIEIRNCSGYYVYALLPTIDYCNARYCGVNGTWFHYATLLGYTDNF